MSTNFRQYFYRALRTVLGKHPYESGTPGVWTELCRRQSEYWIGAQWSAKGRPRVLVATSLGGYDNGTMVESALAVALTLRGAQVDILMCDEFLPACQFMKNAKVPPKKLINGEAKWRICQSCFRFGISRFKPLGLPLYRYRELVKPAQMQLAKKIAHDIPADQIGWYTYDGLSVGEHALAGALRYYARGDLRGLPEGEMVLRSYLQASLLSVFAIEELLHRNKYDIACFHHGIYVPQGLIGEVCRKEGVRVVNWNPAYRKNTFIFSHGDTYHHTMISEKASVWENLNWTPEMEKVTLDYLKSRWTGSEDWIKFHDNPRFDFDGIARDLGLDCSKPITGMLTSVMWDAQLHYRSNAFPSMLEWTLQTIEYFKKRPDLQLVVRVHPAEISGMIPSQQPIMAEIQRSFPTLPSNIVLIPPESRISTYAVMEKCDSVIIYNTKTGIEISSMGIPVIVAGEAWIRNKGFSIDASSVSQYFQLLDMLPLKSKLDQRQLERARKYAFHFFFRRMIPLPFIREMIRYAYALEISNIKQLLPGHYTGLDLICNGILKGTPFIYPAEDSDSRGRNV